MAKEPKSGIKSVIVVWIVGLALGILAGAVTALLLMQGETPERNVASDLQNSDYAPTNASIAGEWPRNDSGLALRP